MEFVPISIAAIFIGLNLIIAGDFLSGMERLAGTKRKRGP
jgi:hypothetical protein